jgi:hypothetical protein
MTRQGQSFGRRQDCLFVVCMSSSYATCVCRSMVQTPPRFLHTKHITLSRLKGLATSTLYMSAESSILPGQQQHQTQDDTNDADLQDAIAMSYPPVPNSPGPSVRSFRTTASRAEAGAILTSDEDQVDGDGSSAIPAGPSTTPSDGPSDSGNGASSTLTPALRMRLSLARRLQAGVLQLKSRSRYILLYQGLFTLAQVATFITLLVLGRKQTCAKPLHTFLSLHIVRIAVSYPIHFYIALAPPKSVKRICCRVDMPQS